LEVLLKNLVQGTIFDQLAGPSSTKTVGYRSDVVCKAANITYKMLDYWTRTGLVSASINNAFGSGNKRLYNFEDIVQIKLIKNLVDSGMALQRLRKTIKFLQKNHVDWSKSILVCDGDNIYASTNNQDFIDVLSHGQGVFGVSIGHLYSNLQKSLSEFEVRESRANALISEQSGSSSKPTLRLRKIN
jgi:DNA-binding transcriptional MerR regulator